MTAFLMLAEISLNSSDCSHGIVSTD